MTSKELKRLALDMAQGKVFASLFVTDPSLLSMIFLPLALMSKEHREEWLALEPSFVFEYYDKAGPRGINGYPIFWSCGTVFESQSEEFAGYLEHYQKQLQKLEEGTADNQHL